MQLNPLPSREVERILKRNGFDFVREKKGHRQFVGYVQGEKRRVTVPANKKEIPKRTLASIIRQSGLGTKKFFGK